MKRSLTCAALLAMGLLAGCSSAADEDTDATTMCYSLSGSTLSVSCYTDYLHSCEEDGMTSLASYSTWEACNSDTSAVLDAFQSTGNVAPGPGASSSPGGGNSSSPDTGGSYDWSYTCPGEYGGGGTLPIPEGSCESQYQDYGRAFGCNLTELMYSTCVALYDCLGDSQNRAYCDNYAGL